MAAQPNRGKGLIREWAETIVTALILALIIRAFVIQVFYIPSGSMEPTLEIGDRIIVNKFIYRFSAPKRFDIIVFEYPYTKAGEKKKDYIKRIIGLPDETLEVRDGDVFINGVKLNEKHMMSKDMSGFSKFKVPFDSYFMMGDNRGNSADSRVWGYMPKKFIKGPAVFRIWPLNRFGLIAQ